MYYPYPSSHMFETLLRRVQRNRWCTNPECTTCGAQHLRYEILRMGPHFLVNDLRNFHPHDEYGLTLIKDVSEILFQVMDDICRGQREHRENDLFF